MVHRISWRSDKQCPINRFCRHFGTKTLSARLLRWLVVNPDGWVASVAIRARHRIRGKVAAGLLLLLRCNRLAAYSFRAENPIGASAAAPGFQSSRPWVACVAVYLRLQCMSLPSIAHVGDFAFLRSAAVWWLLPQSGDVGRAETVPSNSSAPAIGFNAAPKTIRNMLLKNPNAGQSERLSHKAINPTLVRCCR